MFQYGIRILQVDCPVRIVIDPAGKNLVNPLLAEHLISDRDVLKLTVHAQPVNIQATKLNSVRFEETGKAERVPRQFRVDWAPPSAAIQMDQPTAPSSVATTVYQVSDNI